MKPIYYTITLGKDEILKNNANNYRIISAKITKKRAELEEKTEKTIELKKKKTKSKTEQIKARKKALESGSRSLMGSIIMTSFPSPTLHGLKEKNEYKAKSQQYSQISGAGKSYIEEVIDKEFGKNEALYLNNYFQQVEKILAEEFGTSENERIDNFDKLKLTNEFETPQEKLKKQLFAYSITFINVKSIFASDNFIREEEVKKNELEKDYNEKNNELIGFLAKEHKELVENISNLEYLTIQNKEKLERGKKKLLRLYWVWKGNQIERSISSSQTWEELDSIEKKLDKTSSHFKTMLLQLVNNKRDELKQEFFQKLALGVSIPAVILVIFILVSWRKQFKWWVKVVNWWNKTLFKWVLEEEEQTINSN